MDESVVQIHLNPGDDVIVMQNDKFVSNIFDQNEITWECEDKVEDHTTIKNFIEDAIPAENTVIEEVNLEPQNLENDDNNVEEKKLTRKRKRNVDKWKSNIRKKLRQSGKEYIDKKQKRHSARIFRYKECTKCSFKCSNHISEGIAKTIFEEFWRLSDGEKYNFYDKTTTRIPKKRIRKENQNSSRPRGYSFRLKFLVNNQEIRVCRDFYLSVLSISSRRISYFHSQKKVGITKTPARDLRGVKTTIKIPESSRLLVKEHINSFPRVPGHYCRENTKKEYFEFGLNLAKMYELYQEDCQTKSIEPVKKWLYTKIFNEEFNIEFYKPKKDQCDLCCEHENQRKVSKVTAELDKKFKAHVKEKEHARCQKNIDKASVDETTATICFDLQRVLNIPQSNVSKAYYLQKLNVFNLTAYDTANKQGYCIVWYDGISGRAGNDIASALVQMLTKFIENNPNICRIVLWSDACVPQNRNSHMTTALIDFLNNKAHNVSTIEQKFQEPGHSCVQEVDALHSTIDKALSRAEIHSPLDLIKNLLEVRVKKAYIVYQMKKENFKDYRAIAANTNLKKLPYTKVKHVVYEKGNYAITYRTTFTVEEFETLPSILLKKKTLRKNIREDNNLPVPNTITAFKSISEDKINSIRSLYPQFTQVDIEFWECIFKQSKRKL